MACAQEATLQVLETGGKPHGVAEEAASAADPKDGGITGIPGNAPEVAGVRSAAMFMAYANGDWQYT